MADFLLRVYLGVFGTQSSTRTFKTFEDRTERQTHNGTARAKDILEWCPAEMLYWRIICLRIYPQIWPTSERNWWDIGTGEWRVTVHPSKFECTRCLRHLHSVLCTQNRLKKIAFFRTPVKIKRSHTFELSSYSGSTLRKHGRTSFYKLRKETLYRQVHCHGSPVFSQLMTTYQSRKKIGSFSKGCRMQPSAKLQNLVASDRLKKFGTAKIARPNRAFRLWLHCRWFAELIQKSKLQKMSLP